MRVLLDSHALLWFMVGDARLPRAARRLIEEVSEVTFASAASAWEITTKRRLGKLPSASELASDFEGMIRAADLVPLSVTVRHGAHAGALTALHKDPFDRMLIAQAVLENLTLISNERVFDAFGVKRVW